MHDAHGFVVSLTVPRLNISQNRKGKCEEKQGSTIKYAFIYSDSITTHHLRGLKPPRIHFCRQNQHKDKFKYIIVHAPKTWWYGADCQGLEVVKVRMIGQK